MKHELSKPKRKHRRNRNNPVFKGHVAQCGVARARCRELMNQMAWDITPTIRGDRSLLPPEAENAALIVQGRNSWHTSHAWRTLSHRVYVGRRSDKRIRDAVRRHLQEVNAGIYPLGPTKRYEPAMHIATDDYGNMVFATREGLALPTRTGLTLNMDYYHRKDWER